MAKSASILERRPNLHGHKLADHDVRLVEVVVGLKQMFLSSVPETAEVLGPNRVDRPQDR